jgi:hypothetical protein
MQFFHILVNWLSSQWDLKFTAFPQTIGPAFFLNVIVGCKAPTKTMALNKHLLFHQENPLNFDVFNARSIFFKGMKGFESTSKLLKVT